jgi:hypothetical protein
MNRSTVRAGVVAVVVMASWIPLAEAQAQQSTSTAARERYAPLLLTLPVTARLLSLGGAQVAMRDADAVFGNPALVGTATALALGGARYSSSATVGQFASSSTIGPLGIGVGAQMLNAGVGYGTFPASSDVLIATRGEGTSSVAATVAASLSWKQMRWGVGLKYIEERVQGTRVHGAMVDLGASRQLTLANSTVAVALQNVGAPLRVNGQGGTLPTQLSMGITTGTRGLGKWVDVSGTTQLDVRRDGGLFPRAGVEVSYVPIEGVAVTGRVGGRRPQLEVERPVTIGAGFSLDRFTLDYAWEALRDGAGHRMTVRLR